MAQCLITGCALVDYKQQRWIWGDLHQIGDSYVFNAGKSEWRYTAPFLKRFITLRGDYLEMHNIIIAPISHCQLSYGAATYIESSQ